MNHPISSLVRKAGIALATVLAVGLAALATAAPAQAACGSNTTALVVIGNGNDVANVHLFSCGTYLGSAVDGHRNTLLNGALGVKKGNIVGGIDGNDNTLLLGAAFAKKPDIFGSIEGDRNNVVAGILGGDGDSATIIVDGNDNNAGAVIINELP